MQQNALSSTAELGGEEMGVFSYVAGGLDILAKIWEYASSYKRVLYDIAHFWRTT